ncbi:hypothetical protein CFC21_110819 [Triticum aestivum]|uniref:Nucleoplasmin-like domain-containing protein n=2 Tax=Triticum aestivum TaxID=4565 RepID=A0A9R1MPN3_WHEAT|nr:hypothetical protein CFC21_110817 [Triticum aestivum]KAF7110735.1 hypothetical protein CFC21_110819 [Triticum aestivum]
MDMDTEGQRLQRHPLFSWLKCGEEETLAPRRTDQRLFITDVYLVCPGRTAGAESVVAACVEIGTRNLMLGSLSSENPCVKLQTPVELDKDFCFYMVRLEDGYAVDDGDDTDVDADAAVVEFQGFALAPSSLHTEEKDNDDHKEGQETDGEIDPDVARASSAGGNGKDVRQVVAIRIFGILTLVSMLASMM